MKKHIFVFTALILLALAAPVVHAQRLAVRANIANVRSGPGTQYEVIWQVEKYHPLKIIKKTGSWYRFRDFENDEGWLHDSLVNKTSTVITRKKKSNIRSGPGTDNSILYTIEKGIPFKVIKRKGRWIQVQHSDGDIGWLHDSLIW
jgi:SH3-like domain-containing protein